MNSRARIAAAVAAVALAGCGGMAPADAPSERSEAPAVVAPPPASVTTAPVANPAPSPRQPRGVSAGTVSTKPLRVPAEQRDGGRIVRMAPTPAVSRVQAMAPSGFRNAQLAALRELCRSSPPDPRCDGTRVNRNVALAGLEARR